MKNKLYLLIKSSIILGSVLSVSLSKSQLKQRHTAVNLLFEFL